MLSTALDFAKWSRLEGDYLEFGVWQGTTFTSAYFMAQQRCLSAMRFYAFDSFQGLPETSETSEASAEFRPGDYSCTRADFEGGLRRAHVPLDRVEIVPGWFDETLTGQVKDSLPLKRAAIAWVDCDLYESTLPVLGFLTDYVQDGTILIFDDWFCFRGNPERGEQRAFTEWLGDNPEIRASHFHNFGWHGASFILSRGSEVPLTTESR